MSPCPICKQLVTHLKYIEGCKDEIMCKYCGEFIINKSLQSIFIQNTYNEIRIGSWIREQNSLGITPELKEIDFDSLSSLKDKKISLKYELLLKYIYSKKSINIENSGLNRLYLVLFWCEDTTELRMLLSKAVESKHLKVNEEMIYNSYSITYDGKKFVEELGLDNNSNKIFLAFNFIDKMKKEFEKTIIRAINDASDGKLEAIRVSSSTPEHNIKIDDELIAMIKASKAVIADFTGDRTAVYYEAGFAMGLGIPVIWTCKDIDFDKLSFDTRQYPHIKWKDEDDLYEQVVNRLKAKIL
jgi:hypothetical protein